MSESANEDEIARCLWHQPIVWIAGLIVGIPIAIGVHFVTSEIGHLQSQRDFREDLRVIDVHVETQPRSTWLALLLGEETCAENIRFGGNWTSDFWKENAERGGTCLPLLIRAIKSSPAVEIEFERVPLTDREIAELRGHPVLEFIQIWDAPLTSASAEIFASMPKLKHLSIDGSQIDNTGMDALAKSTSIESLNVSATQIGPGALDQWRGNPHLKSISLEETKITDADIEVLATLPALTDCDLQDTRISGLGIKHLSRMPMLERLDLSHCNISAEDVAELRNCMKLTELVLMKTELTDDVFPVINSLNLSKLVISSDKITESGLDQLNVTDMHALGIGSVYLTPRAIKETQRRLNIGEAWYIPPRKKIPSQSPGE